MDRFIVIKIQKTMSLIFYLKSNMDRFIGLMTKKSFFSFIFKIQYGQIYSKNKAEFRRNGRPI